MSFARGTNPRDLRRLLEKLHHLSNAIGNPRGSVRRLTDGGFEPPPQMADLDGDNVMEIVQATAAGRIYAFRGDGTVLPGFPVATNTARNVVPHLGAPAFASGAIAPPSGLAAPAPVPTGLFSDLTIDASDPANGLSGLLD